MISNAISRHAETLDCEFWSRQRRVGTGRGASLGRSRFASTALRYSVLRPVAQLAAFTAFTTLRQGATRMIRTRFALAASPAFLGAPEARRTPCPHAFAETLLAFMRASNANDLGARQGLPGGGDLWGAEEASPGGGARSALRKHSRRACLSEVNAVTVASCATRPRIEHRSGVDAKRDRPSVSPRRAAPDARRATKSEHSRLRARFRIATASHGVQE